MGTKTIGGIVYHEITETTMQQDAAIMREVRSLGFDVAIQEGESPEGFFERVLVSLVEGGQAFGLLGCFLVPEGVEWTKSVAQETADRLRKLTDPGDKAVMRQVLLPYLASFFIVGLTSAKISRSFSAALRGILGSPKSTAAPSTSASGRRLSVRWLVEILSAPWKWLAGRFGKRSLPTSSC